MRNGVNVISEGVFEIDQKKKLFLNLRNKKSKILQYCNYILLKEKEEKFKKSLLENLKIYHKKLSFSPLAKKKINTDREFYYNKNTIISKRSFSDKKSNNKKISFSNNNKQNLTLQKIRYNSANFRLNGENKKLENNNSLNSKRLILIPLKHISYIKNKEIECKITKRKKFNKRLIFKNNNPFYNINLLSQKMNENDMIFPKRFQNFKKMLNEETLRAKDMLIKFDYY